MPKDNEANVMMIKMAIIKMMITSMTMRKMIIVSVSNVIQAILCSAVFSCYWGYLICY